MVGVSELMGEKEIIFPEMAALTIGMWIVDKKVWTVSRLKLVLLMSIGAIVGVCIVRYSPFPLIVTYVGYPILFTPTRKKNDAEPWLTRSGISYILFPENLNDLQMQLQADRNRMHLRTFPIFKEVDR